MKKSATPAFLQKGGGTKVARGEEPSGAKSKDLGPLKLGSKKGAKPGLKSK